ncbi:MAG: M4 family metallopeptidase [Desulfobaccales bacterium]
MSVKSRRCGYIPPFVLENLAKAGIDEARISVHASDQSREKRESKPVTMGIFAGITTAPPGTASREVFDCQTQWNQRVKLVRGEGDAVTADDSVTNAYDFAGRVKEYYKQVLNRNSIDNLGLNLILNAHYGVQYMNAFWDGDEMTFGDGDGTIFVDFTKSLDVVAHELTHGVTQYTANLQYYSQSGALNESFSDVFGTAISQWANKEKAKDADWLIGDEIMGPTLYGEALRSMKEPGTAYDNSLMGKDPQPGHMNDYYTGTADNQGVHINSGIPNKAFYLASMDMETDVAALIWYTALQKLWPTANFIDAVAVMVEAARLLVKSGQIRPGAPQKVRAAFKAVGL